ncbi:MAG: histidine kinase [Bacteroidetes bacterium]|nr:histidine kinase [Bacteroidota bacterium]
MIKHPVFQSLRTFSIYYGIWILLGGVHFFLLYLLYRQPVLPAFTDALIFNFSYSIFGLILWYAIRFGQPKNLSLSTLALYQVVFLAIILFVWAGGSYSLLRLLFPLKYNYQDFLENSIPWRLISGVFYYFLLVLVYYLVIYYQNLQERIKTEGRLNEMVRESELNLLKSQINPHFLFNSLNSISSLTITNPEQAREMTIKLSDFLRYSVSMGNNKFSTLTKELEHIRRYLDIEKVRFGTKLAYDFSIDKDCFDCVIPVMILQPLFENAVKHGVYESTGEVKVETIAKCINGYLELRITNNFEPGAPSKKGAGIGLVNIRERVKLLYKDDQLLKTMVKGNQFEVLLVFPQKKIENTAKP